MPRPIETLLTIPRTRLINRVPIIETEGLVRRFINEQKYHPKLVRRALSVTEASLPLFAADDEALTTLLRNLEKAQYIVSRHSKDFLEGMLGDIYMDDVAFKEFEVQIDELCEESESLRGTVRLADSLADKTKEETIDVARALNLLPPPHHKKCIES